MILSSQLYQTGVDSIKRLGADHVIVTADLKVAHEQLQNLTNGLGVNHAIELTGESDLKIICLNNLACGSTFCPLGESTEDDSTPVLQ